MITFTIITCTFNAGKEIERTLESVLHQTYCCVEHIIQDGLSTDNTLALAHEYQQKSEEADNGHTVRIFSERDNGLYYGMNKAMQKASGQYLVFLNAGDVLPSADTLENISSMFGDGENLPGVLYGDTDIVDENGHLLRHRRLQPPEHLTWRSFRQGMLVCHQAFYARTDLAQATPYDTHYRLSADIDWCIRVMKLAEERGLKLKNLHQLVANYLAGGMSVQNHKASLQERFHIMAHHYGLVTTILMHLWFVVRSVFKK